MKLVVIAHPDEAQAFLKADIEVLVTGFGKVDSAVNLAKFLSQNFYEEIIVLGTAGRVNPNVPVNTILEVGEAVQHDAPFHTETITNPRTPIKPSVSIATGDTFVEYIDSLPVDVDLVDMESYSYLKTALTFDVPIRIFKIVSDDADEGASQEWDIKVQKLSDFLLKFYVEELA